MNIKLKNLIVLFAAFLVSFGLIFGSYIIFNPIKLEREKEEALAQIKVLVADATDFESNKLETIDGVEILLSAKLYKGEDPLGYVYEANSKNGFGNIRVMIAVGLDEKITDVKMVELNQTMYQSKSEALLNNYKFQKLSPNVSSTQAGATSISLNTIMDMMNVIGVHHEGIVKFDIPKPYKDFFGDYEIKSTSQSTISGATVKVEEIDGKGFVYTVTKDGLYQTDNLTKKFITLQVAVNNDGKIIGVLLPNELYLHTKGYYAKALAYAQSFVNIDLNAVPDAYSGVSSDDGEPNNSKLLIH